MKSPKYDLVKHYYDTGMWNEARVRNAVKKGWITQEECDWILYGEPETEPEGEPDPESEGEPEGEGKTEEEPGEEPEE
jgi:hypothetical protein